MLTGAAIMAIGIAIDATIGFAIAEAAGDVRPTAVQALQFVPDQQREAAIAAASVCPMSHKSRESRGTDA